MKKSNILLTLVEGRSGGPWGEWSGSALDYEIEDTALIDPSDDDDEGIPVIIEVSDINVNGYVPQKVDVDDTPEIEVEDFTLKIFAEENTFEFLGKTYKSGMNLDEFLCNHLYGEDLPRMSDLKRARDKSLYGKINKSYGIKLKDFSDYITWLTTEMINDGELETDGKWKNPNSGGRY